jgi:hypothetical protein
MTIQQSLLGSSQSLNFFSAGFSSGVDQSSITSCVAQDNAGNIYYVNFTFGLTALLYKFDSTGQYVWAIQITGTSNIVQNRIQIAFDSLNNVYFIGPAASGSIDLYKFNSSGTFQWGTRYSATSVSQGAITIDSSDNIYVTACLQSTTSSGTVFILKYNTSGTLIWQRSLQSVGSPNTNNQSSAQAIKTDSSGNVYVTGFTQDKNPSASFNGYDAFIAKYDSSGTFQWVKVFGTTSTSFDVVGGGFTIDSSNNIYVSARELPVPTSTGNQYLVSFDTSGNIQSQYKFVSSAGSTLNSVAANISLGSSGLIYFPMRNAVLAVSSAGVVSWVNSFTTFGGGLSFTFATNSTVPNSFLVALRLGMSDYPAAIGKLNINGAGVGTYSLGSSSINYISGLDGGTITSSAGTYSILTSYFTASTPSNSTSSVSATVSSFSGASSTVYI